MIVAWAMDTCDDCRVVVTANTEPQIRTKLWPEIVKWRNLSITRDWWKITKTGIFSVVDGPCGKLAGRCRHLVRAQHRGVRRPSQQGQADRRHHRRELEHRDKVWEVIEGALTDEETEILWLVYGNPTRNTGRFRECFGKHRALWKTRQIDSREVEGTNTPIFSRSSIPTARTATSPRSACWGNSRRRRRCSSSRRPLWTPPGSATCSRMPMSR
jgi:hypothetical protein